MVALGQVHRFEEAPEIYLVDDNMHVIDRSNGHVVLHKVYPINVAEKFAGRIAALASVAELVHALARAPKRKRRKKR